LEPWQTEPWQVDLALAMRYLDDHMPGAERAVCYDLDNEITWAIHRGDSVDARILRVVVEQLAEEGLEPMRSTVGRRHIIGLDTQRLRGSLNGFEVAVALHTAWQTGRTLLGFYPDVQFACDFTEEWRLAAT